MSSQDSWDQSQYGLGDDAFTPDEHDRINAGWRHLMGRHHRIPYIPVSIVIALVALSAYACRGTF